VKGWVKEWAGTASFGGVGENTDILPDEKSELEWIY
jgi:hypothetical protein